MFPTSLLRFALLAACWAAGSALPAAAAPAVKSVPVAEPVRANPDHARAAQLKRLKFAPLTNSSVGEASTNAQCGDAKPIYLDAKFAAELGSAITFAMGKDLRDFGYVRKPDEESVFAETPKKPVDFELGALIQEVQVAYCRKPDGTVEGAAYIKARWEMLAMAAQKVVHTVNAEGSANARYASTTELYRAAADALARNFLADAGTAAWLGGQTPLPAPQPARDAALRLEAVTPPAGGVSRNAILLRAGVVTIEAGSTSGSGFVVSRQGYVLTDQHVVKSSRFVKLRLASGRELLGEVVQTDGRRDVALIKTEAGLDPLSLRPDDPAPGDTVYAIGSPLGEKFSGSLTRGIVSAYRNRDGLRFIQSDVSILSGSSGGPLLDEAGRVVGLTQSGVEAGRARINLFVPIADALKALGIALTE